MTRALWTGLMLALFLSYHANGRSETVPAQGATDQITSALQIVRQHGSHSLPQLTRRHLDALAAGDPVVLVDGGSGTDIDALGVVGVHVVDAPRMLVWLALLGGTNERDPRYTRATIHRDDIGGYVRYQHIDLPWPVRDRHWLIRTSKNIGLAMSSNGRAWQHHWELVPESDAVLNAAIGTGRLPHIVALDKADSIFLEANVGSWSVLTLDDQRSLVVGYFAVDLGGRFPQRLVRSMTRRELKKGLRELEKLSVRVHHTYVGDPVIHDGFGREISPQHEMLLARRVDRSR